MFVRNCQIYGFQVLDSVSIANELVKGNASWSQGDCNKFVINDGCTLEITIAFVILHFGKGASRRVDLEQSLVRNEEDGCSAHAAVASNKELPRVDSLVLSELEEVGVGRIVSIGIFCEGGVQCEYGTILECHVGSLFRQSCVNYQLFMYSTG